MGEQKNESPKLSAFVICGRIEQHPGGSRTLHHVCTSVSKAFFPAQIEIGVHLQLARAASGMKLFCDLVEGTEGTLIGSRELHVIDSEPTNGRYVLDVFPVVLPIPAPGTYMLVIRSEGEVIGSQPLVVRRNPPQN